MAYECITPYSKICTLDSNLILMKMSRGLSQEVLTENKNIVNNPFNGDV